MSVVGDAGAALRRAANAIEQALEPLFIAAVPAREVRGAEDRRQQVVEVVRQAPGQLAQRLHFLRPEQLLSRFFEPELRLALLGLVAGNLGEADQLAVVVLDGVDDHARPEARAVLANPPALGFVAARLPGRLERVRGHAGVEVLGGVEAAEMLADDFVGRITLDSRGARVPVGYAPVRVEHVDCVVGDALDEQPEPPLGVEQRELCLPLRRHVARDLGEADELAVRAVDPVEHDARPEARAVLAHPPAFALELALAPGGFEHLLRQACLSVLLGVEAGEMLADDLVGLEALDARGAGVPACHMATRIQHVDRIVDDRLHEQPE